MSVCSFKLPHSAFILTAHLLALAVIVVPGCHSAAPSLAPDEDPAFGQWDIDSFVSQTIDVTDGHDVENQVLASQPLRLARLADLNELSPQQMESISLSQAIAIALRNSTFVRSRHDFMSPGNRLLTNPHATPSAFDALLQSSSEQSVEAALAAFDLQMVAGVQWGRNAIVQGSRYVNGGWPPADVLVSDTGSVFARLDKPLASGGTLSLVHNWNYTFNNLPSLSFNPRYAGYLRGEFRQPLWSGRGKAFTSIAGPRNPLGGRYIQRGASLAEIDEQLARLEFQSELQQLVNHTEHLYWELWLSYQVYQQLADARERAGQVWQRQRQRGKSGLNGGSAADVAQAEENYHQRDTQARGALDQVVQADIRLRRQLGLPASHNSVFHPTDQPGEAEVLFSWQPALTRALQQRIELLQQQMRTRSVELQLVPAKSLTRPQLDLVTGVQANGLGQELFDTPSGVGGGAVGALLDADDVGWNVGFELSMPWGFRRERNQVRFLNLQLAKARAALAAQEIEVSHQLAGALGQLDRWYAALQSTTRRRDAARKRLHSVEADYLAGRRSLDLMLRSQVSLAEAEIERLRAIAEYNKAIADVLYRQGAVEIPLHGDTD